MFVERDVLKNIRKNASKVPLEIKNFINRHPGRVSKSIIVTRDYLHKDNDIHLIPTFSSPSLGFRGGLVSPLFVDFHGHSPTDTDATLEAFLRGYLFCSLGGVGV
jgi:hypothetical protein